jgi:hypothetical protein
LWSRQPPLLRVLAMTGNNTQGSLMPHPNFRSLALLAILTLTCMPTWAGPPVLNSLPAYESPVSGDPDELLLLSGSGLSVTRWSSINMPCR